MAVIARSLVAALVAFDDKHPGMIISSSLHGGKGQSSHVAGHIDLGGDIFLSPYLGGKNFMQETDT